MLRKLGMAVAAVSLAAVLLVGVAAAAVITIDGDGTDWPGNPSCPPGQTGCALVGIDPDEAAIPNEYDIEQTWFTNDGTYAYFRIDTYAPVNFTRPFEHIDICLDTDRDATTGWVDNTCNSIGAERMLRLSNDDLGVTSARILACTSVACNSLIGVGTFAIGSRPIELRTPLSFWGAITNGQTISMAMYFDNADSPPDDHNPDSGSYAVTLGCGAPGGGCSPTTITLITLNATADVKNPLPLIVVSAVAVCAVTAALVIRHKKTA
jgi:hypothetical protein